MRARWLVVFLVASCTDVRSNAVEPEVSIAARRWFAVDEASAGSRFARVTPNRTQLATDEPGVWLALSPRGGERLSRRTDTTTSTVLANGWERLQFGGDDWYEDVVRLTRPMAEPLRYVVELGPGVRELSLQGARVVAKGRRSEIATTPMVAIDARGRARALEARLAQGELALSLDDRGLVYPVWIDPK